MIIREAVVEDCREIARLWEEFIGYHASLDPHYEKAEDGIVTFALWAEHCIANIDAVVLVAEVDGEVVGYALGTVETYAAIFRRRRYGLLSDLAVTAAHRGKGIGETLARRAIAWFQGAGVGEVHLFVLHNNEGARRFWRKLGWKDFVEQMVLDLA